MEQSVLVGETLNMWLNYSGDSNLKLESEILMKRKPEMDIASLRFSLLICLKLFGRSFFHDLKDGGIYGMQVFVVQGSFIARIYRLIDFFLAFGIE